MYNLLISIAVGVVFFGLGWLVAGHWAAGFPPALLALGVAYVLLARRTGRKLEAVVERVTALLKKQKLGAARKELERALPLARWQFLVRQQLEAQLGVLAYMQRDWERAQEHLDRAWSRDWTAQTLRAVLAYRRKDMDEALAILEKTRGPGKKEAVFWGVYAYLLLEAGKRDEALAVLSDGLKALPESDALKQARDLVSNGKKFRVRLFGQAWYTFFPEHLKQRRVQVPPGRGYPVPRR